MTTKPRKRIAILGAGIMGSSVALELARQGHQIVLFDEEPQPFQGASRWNEGKLHLGYLYAADPTLATARKLLPGGLAFVDRIRNLLGVDPTPAITQTDDHFLVHRHSVVDVEHTRAYYRAVTDLVSTHPGADRYPGNPSKARLHELTRTELGAIANTDDILAGFRVPERSIDTNWLADRYLDALNAEPRIEQRMQTRVHGVRRIDHAGREQWAIATSSCGRGLSPDASATNPEDANFDAVINALWHGRLAIDRTAGIEPTPGWSHRYRVSLFVRTKHPIDARCVVIATGPFGDIKNYDNRNFYLSWYRAGLLAEGGDVDPPAIPDLDATRITAAVRNGFAGLIPQCTAILDAAQTIDARGGWVFANGQGALENPHSTIHRRDNIGIEGSGSYLSVDTGKYSVALELAGAIAKALS